MVASRVFESCRLAGRTWFALLQNSGVLSVSSFPKGGSFAKLEGIPKASLVRVRIPVIATEAMRTALARDIRITPYTFTQSAALGTVMVKLSLWTLHDAHAAPAIHRGIV